MIPTIYNFEDIKKSFNCGVNSEKKITWKCGYCGDIKTESFRNLYRRALRATDEACYCRKINKSLNDVINALFKEHYLLISYSLNKRGDGVEKRKTTTTVLCLKCGKQFTTSYERLVQIHSKKCDCNSDKSHQRNTTTEEFVAKWTDQNKKFFSLCEDEIYTKRNHLYKIVCKKCGYVDIRNGISLMGTDIRCK